MSANNIRLMDLYSKPPIYKFNTEEISFIKTHVKKSEYLIKYGFYKKESNRGCQIAFIIDQAPNSVRRSAAENNWDFICSREISNIEYIEMIQNFGTNRRRFVVYYYKDVDYLIYEDTKYNVDTPQKFIDECKKRGYVGDFQSEIDFNIA